VCTGTRGLYCHGICTGYDSINYAGVMVPEAGTVKQDFALVPTSGSGLWSDATDLGYGWKYLDWFGSFWVDEISPWIYHYEHGWAYAWGDETSSIWFWTSDTVYQWIYLLNSASWGVWN